MTEFSASVRTSCHVAGASLREVADAIAHLPEAGRTSWSPTYALESDGNAIVTAATVRCGFEITMPVWPEYTTASAAARCEWDRWWRALEAHEQGHVDVVTAVFAGVDGQMLGASTAD